MAIKTFKPSNLFVERVEAYRAQRNLQSWSQALVELATIGMHATGVIGDQEIDKVILVPKWGGDRKSAK